MMNIVAYVKTSKISETLQLIILHSTGLEWAV